MLVSVIPQTYASVHFVFNLRLHIISAVIIPELFSNKLGF